MERGPSSKVMTSCNYASRAFRYARQGMRPPQPWTETACHSRYRPTESRDTKQVFRCGFALLLRLHVHLCHDQRAIRLHPAATTMVKQSSGSYLGRVVVTRFRDWRAPVCETDASSPDVTPIPYATRPIPINLGSFFRRSTQDGVRARPRSCFIARP